MGLYCRLNNAGLVVETINTKNPLGDMLKAPDGWTASMLKKSYVVEGKLTLRPDPPQIIEITGGYRIQPYPVSVKISIRDLVDGTLLANQETAEGLDFALPDAGEYRIEAIPPLPYRPLKITLKKEAS